MKNSTLTSLLIGLLCLYTVNSQCPTFYGDYSQQGGSFQQCSSGDVAANWNDQVSSFVVPTGYSVQLYADYGYGGKMYGPYSAGSYNVPAEFNDQLSSIKISQSQPKPQPDDNGGYVQVSDDEINSNPVINDLAQLGSEYLLERALFVDRKYRDLPNSPYTITGIDSIWKKYSERVIYYSFYVQLKCQESDKRLRTTYVVTFNPTNGDTQVIDYAYSVRQATRPYKVYDLPEFVPLDSVASGGYLRSELLRGVDFVVADAIKTRQIPKGNYRAGTTFSVMNDGFTPVSRNIFLTTIVNRSGYTYRVRITVPDVDNSSRRRRGDDRITYEIYPNY